MNFVTQIAAIVRGMSDEELCKLAVLHLPPGLLNGAGNSAAPKAAAPAAKKATAKAAPANGAKRKPGRPAGSKNKKPAKANVEPAAAESEEEDGMMLDVELFVRKSNGVATSEVAEKYDIPKEKAAAILKKLVIAGRIARGGEKRFSRYAKDQDAADKASADARGLAPLAE